MTVSEAFAAVEGEPFAARLNLAHDLAMFLGILREERAVQVLLEAARGQEAREVIIKRTLSLSRQTIDLRYRHPSDTVLATYLEVLFANDPLTAGVAAEAIVQTPQCWWAQKIASPILLRAQARSSAKTPQRNIDLTPTMPISIAQGESASDSLFVSGFVRDHSRLRDVQWVAPASIATKAA